VLVKPKDASNESSICQGKDATRPLFAVYS
jgi:hypothetical protein